MGAKRLRNKSVVAHKERGLIVRTNHTPRPSARCDWLRKHQYKLYKFDYATRRLAAARECHAPARLPKLMIINIERLERLKVPSISVDTGLTSSDMQLGSQLTDTTVVPSSISLAHPEWHAVPVLPLTGPTDRSRMMRIVVENTGRRSNEMLALAAGIIA